MATNTTEQLATLTRLLNTPGLASLYVKVTLQGELQLEVNGPGPLERIKLLLEAGVVTDIYAAVIDKGGQPFWLKNCLDLFDAVQNGWLTVTTTPVGPSPDVIVTAPTSYIPAPQGAEIGDILVFNGVQWTSLAAGPSSYVLTSNGVGFIPSYQPSSGGGGGTIGGSIGKYQVAHGTAPNVIGGSSRLQWNYDTNVLSLGNGTSSLTIQPSIIDTSAATLQLGGSAVINVGGNYTLPDNAGSAGYVLTTDGSGAATWEPSSGGALSIGAAITGSTPKQVLYVGDGGVLAQSSDFLWENSTLTITSLLDPLPLPYVGKLTSSGVIFSEDDTFTGQVTQYGLDGLNSINGPIVIAPDATEILLGGSSNQVKLRSDGTALLPTVAFLNGAAATGFFSPDSGSSFAISADGAQRLQVSSDGVTVGHPSTGYKLPVTDGAPGEVLTTDGAGGVSWGEGSSGNPKIKNQVTAGLSEGDICFLSGANTWNKAQADSTLTAATTGGVFNGTSGSIDILGSVIDNLNCTVDGGMPAIGSRLYLASAAADGGTGSGKATAIPPSPPSGGVVNLQIVGICVDNTNYAAFKTVKAIFQPSYPTVLVG